ncbi:MAG: ferrochelatase [Deltaproteobacteria bacterium]|nr:ferrochelatase [Deltaproteobacteria bacterium]
MKTGVLLVTLGGPRERGEIPAFVRNMTGRELPPPPLKAITAHYDEIGGRSPLCDITEAQSASLQETLGEGFVCRAAFRHAKPSIEDGIDEIVETGALRLVFLSMSPFWSSFTTGDQIDTARAHLFSLQPEACSLKPVVFPVHSWCDNPFFLAAWAQAIQEDSGGIARDEVVLFSVHSLPERLSEEPYREQIERTAGAVAARLSLREWSLGWQSIPASAREPWIGPSVEEVMEHLAKEGARKVVQVPLGFTADHIETLYDIDIAHRSHAKEIGIEWRRVPSLNVYPPFIRALAQIVDEALARPEAPGG